MTDTDEQLYAAAKVREMVRGSIEGDGYLLDHAGAIADEADRNSLTFLANALNEPLTQTEAGQEMFSKFFTDAATEAVQSGNGSVLSNFTGITEQDLDGSQMRLPLQLNELLDNHGAPAFITAAGAPNTGKTNTMFLLVELRDAVVDDLLVLSNVRSWDRTDLVVTSAHDLAVQLLEHRDRPKFVVIDEASTHMDARTNRREVATQYTPLAKRYAKLGVDAAGHICHTGKDLHPEAKRLTSLAFFKHQPDVVEFYERWQADAGSPSGQLFGGPVEGLEPTSASYDPDDAAPWAWNLRPDLFADDLNWDEFLEKLVEVGAAEC